MNTAVILAIVQGLLTYGPSTAAAILELFQKKPEDITPENWKALFDIADKEYADYVPHSKLPKVAPVS